MSLLLLALLSGIPALIYEVVWTREVALLAGSQIEAISLVLVAFFGGLALGAFAFGRRADRSPAPLRLYASLEVSAAALAALSPSWLRALGALPELAPGAALALATLSLAAITVLLGGTLPALLRAASASDHPPARLAGWLVAANTFGAVAGVALASSGIPTLGLSDSIYLAAALALGLAAWASALSPRHRVAPAATRDPGPAAPPRILLAAALAGVATLAFEVITARLAALRLGSSLLAWGLVLGSVLAGLALGNAAGARRAARSTTPARDLGWIEWGAAVSLALSLRGLSPLLTRPASGVTLDGLAAVAMGALLPAICMGAAFPFFVRLAVGRERIAAGFGATSAANTAGGIAGALLVPFALLPGVGPVGGLLACATVNLGLCAAFLFGPGRRLWLGAAGGGAGILAWAALTPALPLPAGERVIFARHGSQATVAVTRTAARRDLLVDGDPEASTAGSARETEELLALLPLTLHPRARHLLEIGLGSGITLATAARFPLATLDCVEIADSVRAAAPYFAPDNEPVASGSDPRIRLHDADGRAYLARHRNAYDIVLANTLHPWSVGATGLYSVEYFSRVAASLRPDGIATQWVPIERLGGEALAAIVRSFFEAFEHGDVWWGANNLLLIGSPRPLPSESEVRLAELPGEARQRLARLGIRDRTELLARRIAGAETVRGLVDPAEVLVDDRPRLERLAARGAPRATSELAWVVELARAEPRAPAGALLLHLESRAAFLAGDPERGQRLERLASEAGLALARRSAAAREAESGRVALLGGETQRAEAAFERALALRPDDPVASFGLAVAKQARGDRDAALAELERLVGVRPEHAEAWNLLGTLRHAVGDRPGARRAFESALGADPFLPEALANDGLLSLELGDRAAGAALLRRLEAIRQQRSPEARALRAALRRAD